MRRAVVKVNSNTERLGTQLREEARRFPGGEALDQVGDWIIECESGEELLSRVSALLAKGGNGD